MFSSSAGPREAAPQTRLRDRFAANRGVVLACAACALFALWTVLGHQSPETKKLVSDLVAAATAAIGAGWGFWGARAVRQTGGDRRAARAADLLALGTATYGSGAGLYAFYDVVLHRNPFPSWADAGYLSGYATMMLGILFLPGRSLSGVSRVRVLLDSLLVLVALVTFSWFFTLGPTVLDNAQSPLIRALGASYPVLDLAMVFCALMVAGASPGPGIRRIRNLLVVGVVAFVVSDTGYLIQSLKGGYVTGQPLDAGWMLTNLLFGQAAFVLRRLRFATDGAAKVKAKAKTKSRAEERRLPSVLRMLAPYALVPAVAVFVVYVYRTQAAGPLTAGVYACAGLLVGLILVRQFFAIAENARLNLSLQEAYLELEALATTDGMTGLANHRVLQERLRQEVDASEASGRPLALLLIDVDRFKPYNDGFGHPAGDQALRIVARLLEGNVRADDLAARYGGEEFAVILPDANAQEAVRVAERIRQACEATAFPHREVTLSVGVAIGPGEPGELIERADLALYAAKEAGRNQVVCEDAAQVPAARASSSPMRRRGDEDAHAA